MDSRRHIRIERLALEYSSTLEASAESVEKLETEDAEQAPLPSAWAGIIGMEQELTGDGRLIEDEALTWETPIPLRFVLEDVGGHEGAVVVGRILEVSRGKGGQIKAHGDFDLGSEVGREAARAVQAEMLNGVSMDLDSVSFEVRVAQEIYEEVMGPISEDSEAVPVDEELDGPPQLETDDEGRVIVAKLSPDDEIMVTTSARIRAATLVGIPAFADAKIFSVEDVTRDLDENGEKLSLVASAAPIEPPETWFYREESDGPTALTITDEGHIYGHLANWDTCHIADPSGSGICVMAPKNTSGYAYFHTGAVKTAEGTLVPTGTIRFNTGHASMNSNAADAAAHYDNTGLAGADVHAIDGKYGIWISGALRPSLKAEEVRTLRASPLSGDWRYVGGKLELVGALAVNLPGFPIPRTQGMVASGALTTIVAAGMLAPERAKHVKQFSDSDARYLQKLIDRERHYARNQLAKRVASATRRQKIESFQAKRKIKELRAS